MKCIAIGRVPAFSLESKSHYVEFVQEGYAFLSIQCDNNIANRFELNKQYTLVEIENLIRKEIVPAS